MKSKLLIFIFLLFNISVMLFTQVYAQSTNLLEYDTVYTVETNDDITTMNIMFNVHNGESESRQPLLIAVMYNNRRISQIKVCEPSIDAGATVNQEITISIPNYEKENYYVSFFVWENHRNLRPLGEHKTVIDIDSYLREKNIYVTANENLNFKVYMNSSTVKGENDYAVHTIEYDVSKIAPVDLCGFTYDNELAACEILNAGIIIENVDTINGIVKYRFLKDSGRNTGVNNIIEFKTLTSITDAEIRYTIQ